MKRLKSQFETESCKVQAVESIYYKADSACLRHKDVVSRRLAQQVQGTERRMKDLVFEIIGEYGKSEERLNRRQDYLLRAAQLKIVGKVTTLRWQRFLLSLCSQSTLSGSPISQGGDNNRDAERGHKISSSVLCSFNDFSEISLVTGAIREASQAAQHPVRVIAVIKLTRSQVPSKRRRISNIATSPVMTGLTPICIGHSGLPVRSVHSNSSSQLCRNLSSSYLISTAEEFLKVTEYLRSWMKPGSNSGKLEHSQPAERAGNSQDKKESDKSWSSISSSTSTRLLSSSGIEWLHPPSFFPSIWEQIHADELRGFHRTESNLRNREKDIEKDRGRERDRDVSVEDSKQDETRRISRFIDKFALQHSSFVSSDRVYFCLEERERAIATRHGKVQDPRRGGGRGEECPSPSLSLSEEQMMLKIYTHLQVRWTAMDKLTLPDCMSSPPTYLTHPIQIFLVLTLT